MIRTPGTTGESCLARGWKTRQQYYEDKTRQRCVEAGVDEDHVRRMGYALGEKMRRFFAFDLSNVSQAVNSGHKQACHDILTQVINRVLMESDSSTLYLRRNTVYSKYVPRQKSQAVSEWSGSRAPHVLLAQTSYVYRYTRRIDTVGLFITPSSPQTSGLTQIFPRRNTTRRGLHVKRRRKLEIQSK